MMDRDELVDGLRGIAVAEPDLGFTPDDVADRAARRLRDRRVAAGTGLVVTVVAVAAVAFAANTGGGTIADTPTSQPPPSSSGTHIERHLREVMESVVPDATQIRVTGPHPGHPGRQTSVVKFRDDAGPAAFNLSISTSWAPTEGFTPLALRCDPNPVDRNGKPLKVPVLANGERLECKKLPQPDGSTIVIEEAGEAVGGDPNVIRLSGLDATLYRPDGSTVGIDNDDFVSMLLAEEYGVTNPDGTGIPHRRSRPPLTEQQLIALVTDPAFTLG